MSKKPLPGWRMACIAGPLRRAYAPLPDGDPGDAAFAAFLTRLRVAPDG